MIESIIGALTDVPDGVVIFSVSFFIFAAASLGLWAVKTYGEKRIEGFVEDRRVRGRSRRRLFSWLSPRALRRYAQALERNYSNHQLGFVEEGKFDVRKAYISLQSTSRGKREDLLTMLLTERDSNFLVLGQAGAGKSVLLKRLVLAWQSGVHGRADRIPVLVELHRLNRSELTLEDLLKEELDRNGLRLKQGALENALDEGRVDLLCDGLDELSPTEFTRACQLLRDFERTYEACRCVVTCRSAVYGDQLAPAIKYRLEIMDFDDSSIQRYLARSTDLPKEEQDQLFAHLSNSPALMNLAASPLVLTMIVYLHRSVLAKTGTTLPASRSEFYGMATEHLLRRDTDLGRNRGLSSYESADKLVALQRMAVRMNSRPSGQLDRLSADRLELLAVLGDLLSDLNLDGEHAAPLLDEIVNRSQLVIRLDQRGSRYSFRHLTLQEYFAAHGLLLDSDVLLRYYLSDRGAWREVIKLFCASSTRNSTEVIRRLDSMGYEGKLLALECLAEAKLVEEAFASELIEFAMRYVLSADNPNENVIKALGLIASEDRPRGRQVFAKMSSALSGLSQERRVAARVMASSRRPQAAEKLSKTAVGGDPQVRFALVSMGEQAIPHLLARANTAGTVAIDDLASIGTPSSAEALLRLTRSSRQSVSVRAAWHLASALASTEIREAMRGAHVEPARQDYSWVARPLRRIYIGAVPDIIAELVAILDGAPDSSIPEGVGGLERYTAMALGVFSPQAQQERGGGTTARRLRYLLSARPARGIPPSVVGSPPNWASVRSSLRGLTRTDELLAEELTLLVLEAHEVSRFRTAVLSRLSLPVHLAVVSEFFCRSRVDASVATWSEATPGASDPAWPASLLQRAFALWCGHLVLLAGLAGVLYISGRGDADLGPLLLTTLTFAAVTLAVAAVGRLARRPKAAPRRSQAGVALMLFVGVMGLALTLIAIAYLQLARYVGSPIALAVEVIVAAGLLGAYLWVRRLLRLWNNPLRNIVGLSDDELSRLILLEERRAAHPTIFA